MNEHLESQKAATRLTTALFIIYLIAMCWILLLKLGANFSYMDNRSVNLVPFRELRLFKAKADLSELILNLLVFIPLGLYTGVLFDRWNIAKKLSLFFLASLLIEGLQFALAIGAFDITDIILNTLGGIIGFVIFKVIEKASRDRLRAQKFINGVAAIGTVLMIVLLLLLKLNLLPVRYQ